MKKIMFTLGFALFIQGVSFAQTHSLAYDLGGYSGFDRGETISKMEDGLMVVGGWLCNNFVRCFGLIKTDFEGVEQWRVHFDNYPYILNTSLSPPIKRDNGNYIIGGSIWHSYEATETRAYLMEFDSLNTLVWRQEYGMATFCAEVKALDDGGFLLYGAKWEGGINRRYFVKTDSGGNMEWEQILPLVEESASDNIRTLELLENGDMLHMVGTKSHTVADGKTLVLMDSDFNTIRSKNLNQENYPLDDAPNVARVKKDGGYVVPLEVDTLTYVEGESIFKAHVVLGLDSLFNIEWVRPLHQWGGLRPISTIIVADNGDIIGCGTDGTFKAEAEPEANLHAGWLFRISAEGELIWDRQYYIAEHLEWHDAFRLDDVVEMPDGRIAATGQRLDRRPDGTMNGNVWLLIVDEEGCLYADCDEQAVWITATEEPEGNGLDKFKQIFFKLSPNPASAFATVELYNSLRENSQLILYSASGQLLDKKILTKGSKNHQIDLSAFPQGIYFVSLERNGRILQREKLILN